jgi:mannitol 2-dehydrogenase
MERHVSFPNSMVDRITPATAEDDRAAIRRRFAIADAVPVVCEPFLQWVLEDRFPAGRPPWEHAGVQLVENVEAYELMKLRLLNGGHQALAYLGRLHGHRTMDEVARDPVFAEFFLEYLRHEVASTLSPVPGIDLAAYQCGLLERFGNAAIADPLSRICADASDRIPKFIFPVIRRRLEQGLPVSRAASVIAGWARYAQGTDEAGKPIEVVDRRLAELRLSIQRSAADPLEFIRFRPVFGDLAEDPRFAEAYLRAAALMKEKGARAAAASCHSAA